MVVSSVVCPIAGSDDAVKRLVFNVARQASKPRRVFLGLSQGGIAAAAQKRSNLARHTIVIDVSFSGARQCSPTASVGAALILLFKHLLLLLPGNAILADKMPGVLLCPIDRVVLPARPLAISNHHAIGGIAVPFTLCVFSGTLAFSSNLF